jgi:hypothetical protein
MNVIFKAMDKNFDGILTREEIVAGFSPIYGNALAQQEVEFIL